MKALVLKGFLLSILFSTLLACNSNKVETAIVTVDKEQIKAEIQAKENEFAEVFNAKEIKEIGYYAEDAISYSQNKPALIGKPAIIAYLKEGMDESSVKISFTTNEVIVSDNGVQVVEIGSYKLVDSANTTINTGNYISIFEKRNGKYYCIRDMSTSDMPRN